MSGRSGIKRLRGWLGRLSSGSELVEEVGHG
jgi:hypothetical protein